MAQYFSSLLSFDPQWGQIVYFFRIIRFWFSFIARSFWNFHKVQVLWEDHEIWKNIQPFFFLNYLVKRKQNGRFFFSIFCGPFSEYLNLNKYFESETNILWKCYFKNEVTILWLRLLLFLWLSRAHKILEARQRLRPRPYLDHSRFDRD